MSGARETRPAPAAGRRDLATVADRLTAWLRGQPGYAAATITRATRPAGAGLSNETFLLDCDNAGRAEALVVQAGPQGSGLFRDYDLGTMARVQARLGELGRVPVAPVLAFEPDAAVIGAPFYLMRRVAGQVPSDNPSYHADGWFKDAGARHQVAAWEAGIGALARLHAHDVVADGFDFLVEAPWGMPLDADPAATRLAQWREFLAWGSRRSLPTLAAALTQLAATRPPPPARLAIAWGDAKISNCIIRDDQVVALLDWELCGLSDPAEDLAFWLVLDWAQCRMLGLERLPALPDARATVACYERAAGHPPRHVHWWFQFGLTRLAIIYHRFLERRVDLGRLDAGADFDALNPVTALLPAALARETLP